MDPIQMAALGAAGLVAGVVNTLAGGGSMLTVPMLVVLGLPGGLANGTNRIGIGIQSVIATWRFRREGVEVMAASMPVLLPVALGSLLGALAVSQLADETFERAFGLVMLAVLAPTLRPVRAGSDGGWTPWSAGLRTFVFFAIGVYGGAFQAGVGIVLILALSRSGYDLVTANAIKVLVIAAITAVAAPVFIAQGLVRWPPALALSAGFAVGGVIGVRLAVRGGERLIRPVLAVAVVVLAGRMLGLY